MLLSDFVLWRSVYYYFSKWKNEGIILADGGYRGTLTDWILDKFGWELEVVLRPDECPSKFQVIPKRWIIERSFAWLENFRRLTIDYEYYAETAVTMIQLVFCKIMLNKYFDWFLNRFLYCQLRLKFRIVGILLYVIFDECVFYFFCNSLIFMRFNLYDSSL